MEKDIGMNFSPMFHEENKEGRVRGQTGATS